MALKKASKPTTRVEEIKNTINGITNQIIALETRKMELTKELLTIEIAPFKIGGYALAEISSGRSKKWQKCLLECENSTLYVRPIKEDGELSGRHFSIIPWGDQTYSDFLKEVK